MSLYAMLAPKGLSGFGYGSTAEDVTHGLDLTGKTYLVTGCNAGLGLETVRVLALRGARVLATARTLEKAQAACAKVSGNTLPVACELSEPQSVRQAVRDVQTALGASGRLDAIICNAGIMALPKLETKYGYELQFFTNHIGHFILVTGLIDNLAQTGRVVMLSSEAHRGAPKGGITFDNLRGDKSYSPWAQYGQSKFANLLFAKELSKKFAGTERTANAVHPGVIRTELHRHMNPLVDIAYSIGNLIALKTIPQGAATSVYVATHPGVAATTGEYFSDSNIKRSREDSYNAATAAQLWQVSEEIVAGLA